MNSPNRRAAKSAWGGITALVALAVIAAGAIAILFFWDWLGTDESNSATIRNIALAAAAVIALPLAIWRGKVAERQSSAAQHQADMAKQSLLNERYQKGAEMLGNKVLSVRLGGIYALQSLANEHPEIYHVQIMQLFCMFVCHPTEEREDEANVDGQPAQFRVDVQAVMKAIGTRNEAKVKLEKESGYTLNLSGSYLRNQRLSELNLSGIQFESANLSGAVLMRTNLSKAWLHEASLSGANLSGANLSGALLVQTDLSSTRASFVDFSKSSMTAADLTDSEVHGAKFEGAMFAKTNLSGTIFYKDGVQAEGLTERQIALAVAIPEDNPPILSGLTCAKTGRTIDWNRRPRE